MSADSLVGPRVRLSQKSLFFPLPIGGDIENIVQLTNLEETRVAFKIRTSCRQRYTVRPTTGILHPMENLNVRFTLIESQMIVEDKAPDDSTRDFFVIEFRFMYSGDDLITMWKKPPQTGQSVATTMNLQCKFLRQDEVPPSMTLRMESGELGGAEVANSPEKPPKSTSAVQQQQEPQQPVPILPPPSPPLVPPGRENETMRKMEATEVAALTPKKQKGFLHRVMFFKMHWAYALLCMVAALFAALIE